jgi:Ca2+-binding EF-hand superfamily protein
MALLPLAGMAGEERGPPPGAAERWAALDTDGDGAVSQAEAQAGAPRMAENFGRLDADGDGRVTREEMHAVRSKTREEHRARAEEHYRSADTNGDGSIDLAEAQNGMPRAAEHFGKIDADGNGLLTREEMRGAMRARETKR